MLSENLKNLIKKLAEQRGLIAKEENAMEQE